MHSNLNQVSFKGLIFDMDGVLVDTSPCHALAFTQLWEKLKLHGPNYAEIAGRSTKEVIASYASNLDGEQQHEATRFKQKTALEILKSANISFDDTSASLHKIFLKNLPMVVATSASRASAELALKNANISQYFSAIITAEDVKQAKPEPDLFIAAIEELGLATQDCLVIEDSESGVAAGLASKAQVVSVRNSAFNSSAVEQYDNYLGHFSNLASLVDQLFNTPKQKTKI